MGTFEGTSKMRKFLPRFARREDGNATVEFVLWLPLMMGIIVGAFDLNVMLLTQSNMHNVARDTARRLAVGDLNQDTAANYARSQLTYMGFQYAVNVTVGTDVTVNIQTYLSDVSVIGAMGKTGAYHITSSVTMRNEQN